MHRVAITREVSPSIARCELTHLAREPIDFERAREQHRAYETALERLGCAVIRLPADPSLPDSVFVEDTTVVLDDVAIIARPGAESRREEPRAVAAILGRYRDLDLLGEPATLDGGDVLRVGRTLYVGVSSRTNEAGIEQLRARARAYEVIAVPFSGCLHLKTAVTQVGEKLLLINSDSVAREHFRGVEFIEADEPFAANALLVGKSVVFPSAYPRTRSRLEGAGVAVVPVDVSELAKAEGGVTCCSVILDARGRRAHDGDRVSRDRGQRDLV